MSTDAIVLLKNDHKEIRKAFRDFQKAGENAHATKGKLVRDLPEAERIRLETRIAEISRRYDALSGSYQAGKADNDIPLN